MMTQTYKTKVLRLCFRSCSPSDHESLLRQTWVPDILLLSNKLLLKNKVSVDKDSFIICISRLPLQVEVERCQISKA